MNTNLHFIGKKALLNVKNLHFVEDFTIHRKGSNKNLSEFVRRNRISDFKTKAFSYQNQRHQYEYEQHLMEVLLQFFRATP